MTAPDGAPFDGNRVENLVTLCLGAIVSAASSFDPVIALPSRQIAAAGGVPYDCEQVFATVLTVTTGTPEPRGTSLPGNGTWPGFASGANMTIFNAVIQLAIVRKSLEGVSGTGATAPPASQYLANLGQASKDLAILMAAISQIQDAQMSATPTIETAASPQGGLVAATARITVIA